MSFRNYLWKYACKFLNQKKTNLLKSLRIFFSFLKIHCWFSLKCIPQLYLLFEIRYNLTQTQFSPVNYSFLGNNSTQFTLLKICSSIFRGCKSPRVLQHGLCPDYSTETSLLFAKSQVIFSGHSLCDHTHFKILFAPSSIH